MYGEFDYSAFFPDRLNGLRQQKKISARKMSQQIGQNKNYINEIENKRALPSMSTFFYMCEFLGVTPAEFFDEGNADPSRLRDLIADLKTLDPEALASVAALVKQLKR